MKTISVLVLAFAAAAVASPLVEQREVENVQTTDNTLRKRVEMTLCRREYFEECTVFTDIEKGLCRNIPSDLCDNIRSITFHGSDDCTFYM